MFPVTCDPRLLRRADSANMSSLCTILPMLSPLSAFCLGTRYGPGYCEPSGGNVLAFVKVPRIWGLPFHVVPLQEWWLAPLWCATTTIEMWLSQVKIPSCDQKQHSLSHFAQSDMYGRKGGTIKSSLSNLGAPLRLLVCTCPGSSWEKEELRKVPLWIASDEETVTNPFLADD